MRQPAPRRAAAALAAALLGPVAVPSSAASHAHPAPAAACWSGEAASCDHVAIGGDTTNRAKAVPDAMLPACVRDAGALFADGFEPGSAAAGAPMRWSDAATWSGGVPQAGQSVLVPAGRIVVLDIATPVLGTVTIEGRLVVAHDRHTALTAANVMLHGGELRAGCTDDPLAQRFTLTLAGPASAADLHGMGSKVLGAMAGGRLELHGRPVASWTRLAGDAAAGASVVEVLDASGWRAGDRLVFATSGFDAADTDVRTIAAIDGTRVTLDVPLRSARFGTPRTLDGRAIDVRAEVGLLSRNIVLQGDEASEAQRFGGHVMVMDGSSARVDGVQFRRMGQFDRLGRYPFHWHLLGATSGQYLRRSAIDGSIQRGIVVHDTRGVAVEDNVVFDTTGHNLVVETEATRDNRFERNLAIANRRPVPDFTAAGLVGQSDDIPSGVWSRSAANRFVGNVVAGSTGMGFFFDRARADGPLTFTHNTVHAAMTDGAQRDFNLQSGILLECGDGELLPAGSVVSDLLVYRSGLAAHNNPAGFWPEACSQSLRGVPAFEIQRVVAIDNLSANVRVRGVEDAYILRDAILGANVLGAMPSPPNAVHLQYGGWIELRDPAFVGWTGRPPIATSDVGGAFNGRFRIIGARYPGGTAPTGSAFSGDTSVVEALDDSYLPRGAYVSPEYDTSTLWTADCQRVGEGTDYGTYRCPGMPGMTAIMLRQGDLPPPEDGGRLQAGTPLHTLHDLVRSDGGRYRAQPYPFIGYETLYGTGMVHVLAGEPVGRITGRLHTMLVPGVGQDDAAVVELAIPLSAAPSAVYRNPPDDSESALESPLAGAPAMALPAAANLAAHRANPVGTYHYDAVGRRLHVAATTRWFVVER